MLIRLARQLLNIYKYRMASDVVPITYTRSSGCFMQHRMYIHSLPLTVHFTTNKNGDEKKILLCLARKASIVKLLRIHNKTITSHVQVT